MIANKFVNQISAADWPNATRFILLVLIKFETKNRCNILPILKAHMICLLPGDGEACKIALSS